MSPYFLLRRSRSYFFLWLLLAVTNFTFLSFAEESRQTVAELDGLRPSQMVHLEYRKNEFRLPHSNEKLQFTHHKVGRVVQIFKNGQVEVDWTLKDGLPIPVQAPESVAIKNLKREVREFEGFHQGKGINYSSPYARKPVLFVGTVMRIFTGGLIEIEWNTRNEKEVHLGHSYWPANRLRLEENSRAGTVYLDPSRVLMALTSFERGLKDIVPDYLSMLNQIVLKRGEAICQIGGYQGLAAFPELAGLEHHGILDAYLPRDNSLVEEEFRRTRSWSWSYRGAGSTKAVNAATLGGAGASFLLGAALIPVTAGLSVPIGITAGYLFFFGGIGGGAMSQKGFQYHTPYSHVVERNETDKLCTADPKVTGKKISPLVFKELRCAKTPRELMKFETSWAFEASDEASAGDLAKTSEDDLAPDLAEGQTSSAEIPDLIDFDTVL